MTENTLEYVDLTPDVMKSQVGLQRINEALEHRQECDFHCYEALKNFISLVDKRNGTASLMKYIRTLTDDYEEASEIIYFMNHNIELRDKANDEFIKVFSGR